VTTVQPTAIRRKIEAWLTELADPADPSAEPHSPAAIALRTRPEWTDDPLITIGGTTVRVVACPTPLAARAALHDRPETEKLVLLTELTDAELGDALLAQVSRHTVRSVDPWELVRQMFAVADLDPTLVGAGRWVCDALSDYPPPDGWPTPPGTVLTRDHALRCLAAQLLGLSRAQIDIAGLLQWTTDAPALLRFTGLPAPVVNGVTEYLVGLAGPAAVAVMAAVRAGHGVDAIPLGLLAGVLWPAISESPGTEIAVARTRLEPRFGGARLTAAQALAFNAAAEAWVDRTADTDADGRREARRALHRAETIAADIDVTTLLGASALLPNGFTHRLRAFAAAVRLAVPGAGLPVSGGGQAAAPAVAKAQEALAKLEEHRAAEANRVSTACMALRLLRWLCTVDTPAPATLYDALHRQVRQDSWVDRARLDVFAGDTDPQVADAYHMLYRAVDARRARHDQQFATLLAAATSAEAEPGALLRVEELLERLVRPILDHGRRVLLLLMDGMSTAAATELAESLTSTGSWLELTPEGAARTGVLAALPTITEVSRCSLFSGRIAVGHQADEVKALTDRFPGAVLLHKGALRARAGSPFDADVLTAMADPRTTLVAAVVNTIDDALDRSDPGTIVWGADTIAPVRDLLALAQDRVVILVSDHGHVIDRGPEGVLRTTATHENRWRPATEPAGDGEVAVSGSRVAKAGGRVVLPWREELRYGPRKAGYHGGAAPAEAVIPLLVLSAGDEAAVPGWAGAPVASPDWWREPVASSAPVPASGAQPSSQPGRRTRPPEEVDTLFELAPAEAATPSTVVVAPSLIDALLASDVYAQRRGSRAPLPNERVAALLGVLVAGGGRATLETLAAHADVPAHRIAGTVTALRKLLQVEGYAVLTVDPDGRTVKLDLDLLTEQFGLEGR